MRPFLLAVLAVMVSLIILVAFVWEPKGVAVPPPPASAQATGGDFTLQSAQGPVSLQDFRGRLLLIYFGYTFCPDICPTSLAATSAGVNLLTPAEQQRVAMLFISVDPKRDTPARLKTYVEFFHPAMRGATGDPETLAELARRYGVFYAIQPIDTAGGGYVVDHSADTYLVDGHGQLIDRIAHDTPPAQVADRLRKYLR